MPNRTVHVLALAAALGALCGCATSSNPELVALKDASVYVDTPTLRVPCELRIEAGIGGVRACRGGALIDLVVRVKPQRRVIPPALNMFWRPEDDVNAVRADLREAVEALGRDDDVGHAIRLSGERGNVRLLGPRLAKGDVAPKPWMDLPLGGGVYLPGSSAPPTTTLESGGGWWTIVQPIAVRTGSALKAGAYTVELTPEFVSQLFPHAEWRNADSVLTRRLELDRGAAGDTPNSPDGF